MKSSSDLEPFRASEQSKSLTLSTSLTKNSQILTDTQFATSNQKFTMDSLFPTLSLDTGIEKLIDEVCSSEINTPDISVFDAFGSQNDHDFTWPESPVPVDKNSTPKNLLNNRQELFSLSPTSPCYYMDNEAFEVEDALHLNMENNKGSTLNIEKFNSSLSSTFQTVSGVDSTPGSKFEMTFRDLVMESDLTNENNVSLPLIPDIEDDSLSTPIRAQHLQDDYSQEYSNFYHSTNRTLDQSLANEETIPTQVPKLIIKDEDDNLLGMQSRDEFDLETIDRRVLDDMNDEFAMDSVSNILSDAFLEAGFDNESIPTLSSKEIQDKIDSFLNPTFEPTSLSIISSFQPNVQTKGNSQIKGNNSVDILKSFKSSPYGKISNGAVLKNVKIMVPSEYKNHFAASQANIRTHTPVKKPQFTIKSFNTTNLINKETNLMTDSTAKNLKTSSSNSQKKFEGKINITESTINYNQEAFKQTSIPSISKGLTIPLSPSPSGFKDSVCKKRRNESKVMNCDIASTSRDNDYDSDLESYHKKKRGKLSLKGLSEAEKYRRIREQNNIASRKCRERKKKSVSYLASEELELSKENTILKVEHDRLTTSLKKWRLLWKSVAERSAAVCY